MSESTVSTTNGSEQTIYGSLDGYLDHWEYGLGVVKAAVDTATDDDKVRSLVNARRIIDGLPFPTPYDTFAARVLVDDFDEIEYELAGAILQNPKILTQLSTGSNVKRVDSGEGVGVEFFNETLSTTGRFPPAVAVLLAKYLTASPGTYTGPSWSSGTGACPDPSGYRGTYGINGGS